jgi:hypothetical protein
VSNQSRLLPMRGAFCTDQVLQGLRQSRMCNHDQACRRWWMDWRCLCNRSAARGLIMHLIWVEVYFLRLLEPWEKPDPASQQLLTAGLSR